MYKPLLLAIALMLIGSSAGQAQISCGTEIEPQSRKLLDARREAAQAYSAKPIGEKSTLTEVPVVVHIFNDNNGNGGLTLQEYYDGIAIANSIYEPAGIVFTDCTAPRFYNDANLFFFEAENDVAAVQNSLQLPDVINIYVAAQVTSSGNALCGFTYFPGSSIDLIVMNKNCFNNGATLSHEFGHYFGLYHTHGKTNCGSVTDELVNGSNCLIAGDDVCDTPADPNLLGVNCDGYVVNSLCEYTGTLTDVNGDLFEPIGNNLMSYAPSSCREILTPQQYDRVAFFLETERDYLVCSDFTPPANSVCDSAVVVNCNEPISGDTRNASITPGDAPCGAVNPGTSKGLWYRYTGTGTEVTASLCIANYDTQLAIYSGGCDDLVCTGSNDDACRLGSVVEFFAANGEEYYLYVTGYDVGTGSFTLELACDEIACPPPADGRVSERTPDLIQVEWTSEPDAIVNLRYAAVGAPNFTTQFSTTSPHVFDSDRCVDYQIQLQTVCEGVPGPWSPPILSDARFCNDTCTAALPITCGELIPGDIYATNTTSDSLLCDVPMRNGGGRWYLLNGAEDQEINVSFCGTSFHASLGVFTNSCGELDCVAGTEGIQCGAGSGISFRSEADQDYWIYVAGKNSFDSGFFSLEVTCEDCPSPEEITQINQGYSAVTIEWASLPEQPMDLRIREELTDGEWTEYLNVSPPFTFSGMEPCSRFELQARTTCGNEAGDWEDQAPLFTEGCSDNYCYSYGADTTTWIAGVRFGDIFNFTGNELGYAAYLSDLTEVVAGQTYPLLLAKDNDTAQADAPHYWRVWIDTNGDEDFDDAGEEVFSTVSGTDDIIDSLLAVPATPYLGATRMRIALSVAGYPESCATGGSLSVEDYTLIFRLPPPVNDMCPDATAITCDTTFSGSTAGAEGVGELPFCGDSLNTSPGVWYSFVGNGENVTADLCTDPAYDSQLGVYTGENCTNLECVISNDNGCGEAARVDFTTLAGVTYYLYVTSNLGEAGEFTLSLTCELPCPDPEFALSCPVASFNRSSAALPNEYRFFAIPDGSLQEATWLINRMPIENSTFAESGPDNSLSCRFPTEGTYEICYSTVDEEGCEDYCCSDYCIDFSSPRARTTATQLPDGSGMELALLDAAADEVVWYTLEGGNAETSTPGATLMIPYSPDDCMAKTYYCSYRSEAGCYQTASISVQNCDPGTCANSIAVERGGGDTITCSVNSLLDDISWMVDGAPVASTTGISESLVVTVPAGTTSEVCVTSYNPVLQSYATCCRMVETFPTATNDVNETTYWAVFPNPATHHFQVTADRGKRLPEGLALYDVNGRKVRDWSVGSTTNFSITELPAGVYFLRIWRGRQVQLTRLMVR